MPTLPHWYMMIVMWERTGTPPWTIAGGGKLFWFLRYRFVYRERARIEAKRHR